MKNPFLMMLIIIAVTGCGSEEFQDDDGSFNGRGYVQPPGTVELNTSSKFIDAPVSGLTWSVVDGSESGVTDSSGDFNCTRGQLISFEIGQKGKGLHLGNAPCGEKIFLHNLDNVVDALDPDDKVSEIGSVLQSVAPATGVTTPMVISSDFQNEDQGTQVSVNDITFNISEEPDLSLFITTPPASVSKTNAKTHIDGSLSSNSQVPNELLGYVNSELPSATNFNDPIAREREFRITAKGTGDCSQTMVDLQVGLYKASDSSPVEAYMYATFDRNELLPTNANGTYCDRISRLEGNDFDGKCYGYLITKQIVTSKDIMMKARVKDVDNYFDDPTSDFSAGWYSAIADQFDLYGSVYLDGARIKGQLSLDKIDQTITDMPDKCVLAINQRSDDFVSESGEVKIPKSLIGQWALAPVNPGDSHTGPRSSCYDGAISRMTNGETPSVFSLSVTESGIEILDSSSIAGSWSVDGSGFDDRSPGTIYFYTSGSSQWDVDFHYNIGWSDPFGAYVHIKGTTDVPDYSCNLTFVKQN